MWWTVLVMVAAARGPATAEQPKIHQLACLGTQTVIATDMQLGLVRYDGARWQPVLSQKSVTGLWRTPDGRVLAQARRDGRPVALEIREGVEKAIDWILPEEGRYRFEVVEGKSFAVHVNRRYRLDPDGAVTALEETPLSPRSMRPEDPPILLRSSAATAVCSSTSQTKAHDIAGHCAGIGSSSYDYRAEFGGSAFSGAEGEGVDPFLCAGVVISARRGTTQARRLTDGVHVGSAPIYPRSGSQCLSGDRVFIVGKREVGVYELPRLRALWRRGARATIANAVVCAGKVNTVRDGRAQMLTTIDLPAEFVSQ